MIDLEYMDTKTLNKLSDSASNKILHLERENQQGTKACAELRRKWSAIEDELDIRWNGRYGTNL